MQLLQCPFCGLRSETEFHFEGQAGKPRPENSRAASAEEWADYLYRQDNLKGRMREVWVHLPCQEYFVMERNTVTMAVYGAEALDGDME
ncbi:sarcosine oxidase subunit delta [Ruegeria atlantica]|uniref:sarcosine oxidase subunit delta n=1 Tax=Ruegeria atlantica TaxID=81569 RepID=UPI00147BA410|nr:sarcosine oxidase subunit delta [Ruegeria atlantica]